MIKYLLTICFLIVAFCLKGQMGVSLKALSAPPQLKRVFQPVRSGANLSKPTYLTRPTFPIIFKADQLPFFCKIEHQFNAQKQLPIKIRLGNIDYVDYLEGKSKVD